jgi:cytochrome oxidase assembly protein ShyY1
VNLRNSHLQYAGTWYGLAGVLFVIFIVFHWRRDNE